MADPQMEEFYGRLRRVAQNQRRGAGFEVPGTVVRTRYRTRARAHSPSLLRPALLLLAVFMVLKSALLVEIGPVDYQGRVDRLRQGSQIEAAGAWALQMDPITIWTAGQFRELFKHVL
jgi:hypothetical protein